MTTKKKTEIEEPEVIEEVTEDAEVDLPTSDDEVVEDENLSEEEFFQMSEIGEDEDEVTDDEISEDM